MCESSGLKFFGTTTEIQSGANAFEESRFVVNFLTILGVTTILCNFSLVPGGKTCREILESSRLEFLENFNHTVLLYLIQKTTKVSRAKFLGSDKLFCFSKHIEACPLNEPLCNDWKPF